MEENVTKKYFKKTEKKERKEMKDNRGIKKRMKKVIIFMLSLYLY